MKAKERKTLITDEAQIRVGDLLELRKCLFCGKSHRQLILVSKYFSDDTSRFFEVTNKCPRYRWVHYTNTIAQRRLYRIDTGLEDEANPYVAVKAPKTRVTQKGAGR